MLYVLVPVVLQWDVIVLDDCVPDVFVMGAFQGCLFYISVCIMSVCRIYILSVHIYPTCAFDEWVAILGMQHLCVFNAQIWNVCLQNVCD